MAAYTDTMTARSVSIDARSKTIDTYTDTMAARSKTIDTRTATMAARSVSIDARSQTIDAHSLSMVFSNNKIGFGYFIYPKRGISFINKLYRIKNPRPT